MTEQRSLLEQINTLEQSTLTDIKTLTGEAELEQLRVDVLGKKGRLTDILKSLASLPADARPVVGALVNKTKQIVLSAIEDKKIQLKRIAIDSKINNERIDITLPGRCRTVGSLHPVTQVRHWIVDYFVRLGFDMIEGPEIETEYYNFEALNIPAHHPARAMHDTFYFGDGRLLRTHTSPVQIRSMEHQTPPFRLIAPGRVYRCDSDVTHTPMFHQVEGLCIDERSNLAELRGLLYSFFSAFFEKEVDVRFRPSYFPFTEPSAEVDIQCTHCSGRGCRSCQWTGWLEVLGCGMVHPKVLASVGLAAHYQGWAFGLGMDRLAMLYYGIDDLRMMFENDLNFLRQF